LSDVPGPRPVFQLCCIQFLSSQHVQGLKKLATSSSPANRHTLVAAIHAIHATAIYMPTPANIHADQPMPAE
jgi:hypothetical protein